jgi:hypothetical protein
MHLTATDLYATTALAGSVTYLACRTAGLPLSVRIIAGVAATATARKIAWTHDVRLPTWARPHEAEAKTEALSPAPAADTRGTSNVSSMVAAAHVLSQSPQRAAALLTQQTGAVAAGPLEIVAIDVTESLPHHQAPRAELPVPPTAVDSQGPAPSNAADSPVA